MKNKKINLHKRFIELVAVFVLFYLLHFEFEIINLAPEGAL